MLSRSFISKPLRTEKFVGANEQIEKEKNEAIVHAKLAEERYKHLGQEKERHDKQVEVKHRAALSQNEAEVDRLSQELK